MKYTVIYNQQGNCIGLFSSEVELKKMYPDLPNYAETLGKIVVDEWIDYWNYQVIDNKLVKKEMQQSVLNKTSLTFENNDTQELKQQLKNLEKRIKELEGDNNGL